MIKNIFKIFILLLTLFLLFLGYFAYFGITTSKFNSIIKDQIKKQSSNLDVDLKKVKLHLDLKNLSIKIKTKNPKIILNDSDQIELSEVSSNILISSYFQNKFAIRNLSINSKSNEISSYINLYRTIENSLQTILLNQFIKSGMAQVNIDLNFEESGRIKNNFNLTGKVLNAELQIPNNKNIEKLNFNFSIEENNYNFNKILFDFNKINFNSEYLKVKEKDNKFFIKGNLKNKKNEINNELILLIFNNNLKNFDFSNTKFDSTSEFTFDLSKKFKIRNLKVDSKINLDELKFKYELFKINYIKNYDNLIKLNKNKLNIQYSENKFIIDGSSEFYIEDNSKNLLNFKVNKSENKTDFNFGLNLDNIGLEINDIGLNKKKKDSATLQIKGSKNGKLILFNNIIYTEDNNVIKINNLKLNNNKILNIDKIRAFYLTENNFKNDIVLSKKDNNYELIGKSFDCIQVIENISNSETDKNFFKIFKDLNTKIRVNIDEVKLDDASIVNNLNGNLEIRDSKIFDLNLNSDFTNNEKLFFSIKTQKDGAVATTFYSDRAKPFVKKYKFIKGFEDGNLDFSSIKVNNVSKSKLIIDNFKVKEVPVLAKILTLASLQGIADLLTGEGVRFTDFEMIYSNKGSLMTIDEMYAIGPAISIMIEGYVESKKLISLRGTLVPATTINRSISSIPLIGDILVGKKVGEGVFGVSFKIKGPPKNLKTKVNPIKTLTPRFITRTLEKIKKN